MAYLSKKVKKEIDNKLKENLKSFDIKWTTRNDNYNTYIFTIRKGKVDFLKDMNNKEYHEFYGYSLKEEKKLMGEAKQIIEIAKKTINTFNYDNSDSMYDHFDIGYFVTIQVGDWEKPYIFET